MIKKIDEIFLKHPREKNVSYFQHLCVSMSLSVYFFTSSIQAFVHALVPCYFETSSSDTIRILDDYMKNTYKEE